MNGGATVQGNMLRLQSSAPLEVNGTATLKGATTVNGTFTTTGGYWMNGGATVNNSALLLNSGSDLQVQGTFMRRYSLTAPGANGFAEIQFGVAKAKTTKMDIILCITGHNTGLGNKIIAIYINGVVAAQTHILPNAQASLTVPIPKGQTFYMDRDHANVHGFCGYVTTFASSGNNWANIW